jgi:hypothetical protein
VAWCEGQSPNMSAQLVGSKIVAFIFTMLGLAGIIVIQAVVMPPACCAVWWSYPLGFLPVYAYYREWNQALNEGGIPSFSFIMRTTCCAPTGLKTNDKYKMACHYVVYSEDLPADGEIIPAAELEENPMVAVHIVGAQVTQGVGTFNPFNSIAQAHVQVVPSAIHATSNSV